MPEVRKQKIISIMNVTYMSSEDEGEEEVNGSSRKVFKRRKLEWRSPNLDKIINGLDSHFRDKIQTKRSRDQTVPRVEGEPSTRAMPEKAPLWAVVSQQSG